MIKRIKKSNLLISILVLIGGLFIILISRITYAYFGFEIKDGNAIDIDVLSSSVDRLDFDNGDALSLIVTSTTLGQNVGNLETISYPKASLIANNETNLATYNYNVLLTLSNNTFTYTTQNNIPEIMLTVIDPEGVEVTSIEGLSYSTIGGVSGFDVTTYNGDINIVSNYEILSNSSTEKTEHIWTVKLTYINLATDQSNNLGKNLTTQLLLEKS
ncbi:MAG: hypothetical protein E7172_01970 [Firmicutes bacterium]|nr:hypothetical protein [Bacillota bacterium]